jgi:ABC-2 type transport system permease protein
MFHHSPYFAVKGYRGDYDGLQQALDRGVAMVALVVPSDFAAKVRAAKPVKIQIIGDGSDANTSRLALNYAANIGAIYAREIGSEQMQLKGRGELKQPVELRQRSWYNPGLRSQNVLIPGIIALVMIVVAALLTSTTVAKEWEMGTMEQLISTPLRGPELVFGKVFPYFCIGLIDVSLAVLMGKWIFDVPIVGNAGLLFLMSSIFLTGALFFGLTLSIRLKSQVLANQLAIIVGFLPTLILSGFVFAIENMPVPLQFLTYIVPARYFIAILRGIYLKGIGLEILWLDALFLSIYALIMMVAAHRNLVFKLE